MLNDSDIPSHNRSAFFTTRMYRDIAKLQNSGFDVQTSLEKPNSIAVIFKGPDNSLYKDGRWQVQVYLPTTYPLKPPSIAFVNKIFHPNIDMK